MSTRRIIQLINGMALLIGVLWLYFKPDFEPALTSLTLIATLIGLIVEERVSTSHVADLALFEKLKQDLPSSGSIAFIDTNNFAGFSFENDKLRDLNKFVYTWNDAEHEFLSKTLEKRKGRLLALVNEFLTVLAEESFSTQSQGRNTVPPEWEIEQPERFKRVVSKIHGMAKEIVAMHQDLFRLARRKLKC